MRRVLLFMAFVALVAGWYFQERLKAERYGSSFSELLFRIHGLDVALDRDMERIATFRLANYDSLVWTRKKLRAAEKELERLGQKLLGRSYPDLAEAVARYKRSLERKLELLNDMKSHAAVVRNSLSYLPDLMTRVAGDDEELQLEFQSLLNGLLMMQLFPDRLTPEQIATQADALQLWGERTTPVLRHVRVSLRESEVLQELIGEFQRVDSQQLFNALHERFLHHRASEGHKAILLGVALLALVLLLAFWLWRTLRNLHRARLLAERSHHRLEDAVESLGEAFALFDNRDRLVLHNRTFCEFYPWLKDVLRPGLTAQEIDALSVPHLERSLLDGKPLQTGTRQSLRNRTWIEQVDGGKWYLANNRDTSEGGSVWVRTDITRTREAELELRKLGRAMEQSPASVVITDTRGIIEYVNPKFEEVSGYSEAELIGQRPSVLKGGDLDEEDYARMWKTILAGKEWKGIFHNRRKDGSMYWESAIISPIRDDAGNITHFIGIKEDITRLREYQESLRLSAKVFDATTEGIILTDAEGRIRTVNPAFTRITGYEPEEVLGRPASIFDPESDSEVIDGIRETLEQHQRWSGEITEYRKDGTWYHEWISVTTLHDEKGDPSGYVIIFSDITQHKADQARILYQANYDLLTGLPNRTLLMDRLHQGLLTARRHQGRLAVLFIDLDRFKAVNDLYGHGIGDELLQQVADRLKGAVREVDTIARFGGDEFVILLQDIGGGEDAALVAKKVIELISQPFDLSSRRVTIGASIGITLYPNDISMDFSVEESGSLLLSNADMAMYQAKARGRNHFQFFEQRMQEEIKLNLSLEQDMRNALANGELQVYYQPIHQASSNRIVGVEALLRWHHPERGMISPASFIPLAEETGLIYEIGNWVFHEACRQVKAWHDENGLRIGLSVNLSARQRDRGFGPEALQRLLDETGLDARYLTLEITENLLLEESDVVLEWLHGLKATGVSLSVDDFGTGYSSLSYLKQFPVDSLKVDQSFVRGLPEDKDDASLVKAIIAMASSLGLGVVAEGVETEAQREFLLKLGCAYMQGYRFDPPLPAEEILRKFAT